MREHYMGVDGTHVTPLKAFRSEESAKDYQVQAQDALDKEYPYQHQYNSRTAYIEEVVLDE